MRANLRQIVLAAAVVLWPMAVAATVPQEGTAVKNFTMFMGQCRFQLYRGFIPCDGRALWTKLKNDRAMLTFTKGDTMMISLAGGADRQPDLEDCYLEIDQILAHNFDNGNDAVSCMAGECHFYMNEQAT